LEQQKSKAERLLDEIKKSEEGNFTLYLGAAAGVGKTYAMLAKAHQLKNNGIDVVLGYLEAHGRLETESLADGLDTVPVKKIVYAGKEFDEVNVEDILERDPEVILIDELAHTNTQGSKYAKRYQDVLEILSNGIDVIATMNIQHIESLNDVVFSLTGVRVYETVPDSILERVDSFRLIDTPPDELIERLKEGKIYPKNRIESALNNFFTEQNLSKLRELSLRKAATKVNDELNEYSVAKRDGRRVQTNAVMVCIDHHEESMDAVRYAKRLSDVLKAELIALQITSDAPSSAQKNKRIRKNIRLSERLGAKVVSKVSGDKTDAVLEAIDEYGITELVMTRPKGRFLGLLFPNLTKSVMARAPKCVINIVPFEKKQPTIWEQIKPTKPSSFMKYLVCSVIICLLTAFCFEAKDALGIVNITLLYLLTTLFAAVRYGVRYSFFTALSGVLLFDFLFIEPYYSFSVTDVRYILSFIIFLIVGYTAGTLSDGIKAKNQAIKTEETRFRRLYELSAGLGDFENEDDAGAFAIQKLHAIFGSRTIVLIPDEADRLKVVAAINFHKTLSKQECDNYALMPNEQVCSEWAYRNSESAGRYTNTLPNLQLTFFPSKAFGKTLAVVALELPSLDGATQELLYAFMNTLAVSFWRIGLSRQNQNNKLVEASEKLTSILFNSVYHELKTPLATISGAVSAIKSPDIQTSKASEDELLETIEDSAIIMENTLKNLLDFARIENGLINLKKDWCDIADIVNSAYQKASKQNNRTDVECDFEIDSPPILVDYSLVEQALFNLFDNALKYSKSGKLKVKALKRGGELHISISNPSDIDSSELVKIFDKFYRAEIYAKIKGSGLGLAIAKGIIQAHKGDISAAKRHGDFILTITLPIELNNILIPKKE
jgi:two-component system, OmpR family, sensor histidine kinase KdpD